jgi:hypothetical protein
MQSQVFLPAIAGHVPDDMVRCIAAFLDFCYLARRSVHTMSILARMEEALDRFHHYRQVFVTAGIRPTGFKLPRQHTLVHFVRGIIMFGSPNGVCTSITKSKHIEAVKKPWRRSNRFQPIGQIIHIITRIGKLAAALIEFGRRGMIPSGLVAKEQPDVHNDEEDKDDIFLDVDGERTDSRVTLGNRSSECSLPFNVVAH